MSVVGVKKERVAGDHLSIVGGDAENRRIEAPPVEVETLSRRGAPAIFIVDEFLNVLYHHEDPHERRADCRMPAGRKSLPPLVERTVVALLRRTLDGRAAGTVLSATPNASVVVRAVPLTGSTQAYAVIVERVRLRRHLQALAQRFRLSERERQVLDLLAKGAKNSEIAQTLSIAESTAIFHVKRLLAKTNSRNRTELVSKAVG